MCLIKNKRGDITKKAHSLLASLSSKFGITNSDFNPQAFLARLDNLEKLAATADKMLNQQQTYFKSRTPADLQNSKELEKQTSQLINIL